MANESKTQSHHRQFARFDIEKKETKIFAVPLIRRAKISDLDDKMLLISSVIALYITGVSNLTQRVTASPPTTIGDMPIKKFPIWW